MGEQTVETGAVNERPEHLRDMAPETAEDEEAADEDEEESEE